MSDDVLSVLINCHTVYWGPQRYYYTPSVLHIISPCYTDTLCVTQAHSVAQAHSVSHRHTLCYCYTLALRVIQTHSVLCTGIRLKRNIILFKGYWVSINPLPPYPSSSPLLLIFPFANASSSSQGVWATSVGTYCKDHLNINYLLMNTSNSISTVFSLL